MQVAIGASKVANSFCQSLVNDCEFGKNYRLDQDAILGNESGGPKK